MGKALTLPVPTSPRQAYRDVSAMTDLNSASASTVRARLRASRMPWHEGSFSWRMASLAAKQSLAAVSGWSARRPTFTTTGGTSGRVAVRIWAFGTHCSATWIEHLLLIAEASG
eukprot:Skav223369  [mRNA]  locus=scaffold1536:155595:165975:+ [translate_table: standard]